MKIVASIISAVIGIHATSATRYELVGTAENMFNNQQLEKENFENRLYANLTWNSEDGTAVGMLGSGSRSADDDGIFHFAAKCVAVSDDESVVFVGGELVAMPGKPLPKRRHLQTCPGGVPASGNAAGNTNYQNGVNHVVNTPAGGGGCGVLFTTACNRCYNSKKPPYNCQGARHLKVNAEEGCIGEDCIHGSQGIYRFNLTDPGAAGFHVPTLQPFDWGCAGFKEVAEAISFDMDELTQGNFTMKELVQHSFSARTLP